MSTPLREHANEESAKAAPPDERVALAREASLAHWLRAHGSVLVGFSGGVDSAYLASLAVEVLGREKVLAVIGRSASYPAEQWATARRVADQFGIPVLEVDTEEMNDPRYAANPVNRCYFCKTELWDVLVPLARERGLAVVVDGTNADDLGDYRPGATAAREHGVASPMAQLGLTKTDIRLLSQRRGIPTWSQPSSPCLSSRLPYGTSVTPERLASIERAEAALRSLGVSGDLRVRYHDDLARVELSASVLQSWLEASPAVQLAEVVRAAGFARVAIDLRGFRSGSLNILGGVAPSVGEVSAPESGARGKGGRSMTSAGSGWESADGGAQAHSAEHAATRSNVQSSGHASVQAIAQANAQAKAQASAQAKAQASARADTHANAPAESRPAPQESAALRRLQASLDDMQLAARAEERGALAILVPCATLGHARTSVDARAVSRAVSRVATPAESTAATSASPAPPPSPPSPPPAPPTALTLDPAARRAVVQAVLAAGFSHVAVEVPLPSSPRSANAPLRGGHPA
ncbi:MAG: ATP-dependent sacrificial sulfur transferase LarE [Gemmatimonadaceae bacterium]|nr:ATP-dependent sacrificial sulfur transferase LarE [Gemmatimonadaceae bacterium]